jgi:Domain of unknown function (DUF4132)/HEAT repeats
MTLAEKLQKIDDFKKFTAEQYGKSSYCDCTTNCDEIVNYLLDNKAPFPFTPLPTYTGFWLDNLEKMFSNSSEWDELDIKLLEVFTSSIYWKNPATSYADLCYEVFFDEYLHRLHHEDRTTDHISNLLKYWHITNLGEDAFLKGVIHIQSDYLIYSDINKINSIGNYLVKESQKDFEKVRGFYEREKLHFLLEAILVSNSPINETIIRKLIYVHDGYETINIKSIATLLKFNFETYEDLIVNILKEVQSPENYHAIAQELRKVKSDNNIDFLKEGFFQKVLARIDSKKRGEGMWEISSNYNYQLKKYVTSFELELTFLTNENIITLKDILIEIFDKSKIVLGRTAIFEKAYHLLSNEINNSIITSERFFQINTYDASKAYYQLVFKNIKSDMVEYLIPHFFESLNSKDKKVRETTAILLANFKNTILPQATQLLQHKKPEMRQTGALILSLIKTDEAIAILNNALENEINDDARDLMLDGLKGIITIEVSQQAIAQKVAFAQQRGKLDKPIESWLDDSKLPPLYFTDGTKLNLETVRFLLYRMSRAKDIRIDFEAKTVLDLIDKNQSSAFANALLNAYIQAGGADSKQKYCLTIGSILGADPEMDILKHKVNEWVEASRGKMAEYAVKALALNGSTKALRAVEFFSRKYKNKYKNIGAAAIESFGLVAEELGISPYDLADSIIPDFGFEGLFKEFEVNNDIFRAFIGNDFKLAFLNEDNKALKSLPKGASKEIQEEFKEIGKEIKDIVKSQSSRLEQYLVIQRKWSAEKWQAFFLTNPVMFVYAVRLIWGAFDENQKLLFTFKLQEDQTLINEEGDEIELEEDLQIGMVHPISLSENQLQYWKEVLYDSDLSPIFPQLDRPLISFNEKDKGITLSKEFEGIQYGGYSFVSKLEKLGWFRGSVVDAGGISSYYKDFSELNITAIIMQIGMIGIGYLEENAELGELMFVSNKSVKFGSYMYDEPSKANDERLISFEKVPPIVYSEVMADMQFFKENDVIKQNDSQS